MLRIGKLKPRYPTSVSRAARAELPAAIGAYERIGDPQISSTRQKKRGGYPDIYSHVYEPVGELVPISRFPRRWKAIHRVARAVLITCVFAHPNARGGEPEWLVTVCLNPGNYQPEFNIAEGITSHILLGAGVRLLWRRDAAGYAQNGAFIQIHLSTDTPSDHSPGALGEAFPYEGSRIVIFYDRVRSNCQPTARIPLLGHIMAHEIVHLLEGTASHSSGGLMKALWTTRDRIAMDHGEMRISDDDIDLIHAGLERQSRLLH